MKKPDWKIWMKDRKECKRWLNLYSRRGVLRKSGDESRLYLSKSEHNLNFANWIFEKHNNEIPRVLNDTFYDWLVNIYYYAIYHTALALVSREGFNSKSHSATLCFLIYHHYYLQKEVTEEDIILVASSLDKEDIETIGDSKELRERASYNVQELFERKLAEQIKDRAIEFSNKIKEILAK